MEVLLCGYSTSTLGVLSGYSRGALAVLYGTLPVLRCALPESRARKALGGAPPRLCATGGGGVLQGYSQGYYRGTQGVRPGRSRGTHGALCTVFRVSRLDLPTETSPRSRHPARASSRSRANANAIHWRVRGARRETGFDGRAALPADNEWKAVAVTDLARRCVGQPWHRALGHFEQPDPPHLGDGPAGVSMPATPAEMHWQGTKLEGQGRGRGGFWGVFLLPSQAGRKTARRLGARHAAQARTAQASMGRGR